MNEMARFQRSPVKEPDMLSGICGSLCPIYGPWSCHKALMTLMKKQSKQCMRQHNIQH